MAAGVIVGGAVGVATLYLWGWRRFKYMRAYWRNNKQTVEFERQLREARDAASVEHTYRAATSSDSEVVALLRVAEADEDELHACGFATLGDAVFGAPDQPATAVLRTLVDRSQTTCATLAVSCKHPELAWLSFVSYRDDEAFVTVRGPQARLAEPPTVHRQTLERDLPSAKLAAQHRVFARTDDKPCVRVGTLAELLAPVQKVRAQTTRWRERQEPDVLLDADLRCVLGAQYDKVGRIWARRLRSRLPAATLRRS